MFVCIPFSTGQKQTRYQSAVMKALFRFYGISWETLNTHPCSKQVVTSVRRLRIVCNNVKLAGYFLDPATEYQVHIHRILYLVTMRHMIQSKSF